MVGTNPAATMLLSSRTTGRLNMFFADQQKPPSSSAADNKKEEQAEEETPASSSSSSSLSMDNTIELVSTDDENFLNMVGFFLVDAFWLNSDHHHQIGEAEISQDSKMNLCIEQASDLQEKYGERLGKRLLESRVIAAFDKTTNSILGVVTFKETLFNEELMKVLEAEQAESILKNAVATLGPKQRRQYKNASVQTICDELLVTNANTKSMKPVCVLSNLAISKTARRQGIGQLLCEQVEYIVKEELKYDELYLLVENDNIAGKTLYESKLNYECVGIDENAIAIRANIQTGEFVEISMDTLIMKKVL